MGVMKLGVWPSDLAFRVDQQDGKGEVFGTSITAGVIV